MTPNQKKIAIGVVAGLVLLYLVSKSPSATNNPGNDPTGNGDNTTPGSTPFNAQKIANGLLEAMRYTGTDEEEIQNLLRTVTQSQFGLVFKAFGKPQYNATLGNQTNPTAWFDQLPYVDLAGWLKNEMSTSEYATLRLKYPKYL